MRHERVEHWERIASRGRPALSSHLICSIKASAAGSPEVYASLRTHRMPSRAIIGLVVSENYWRRHSSEMEPKERRTASPLRTQRQRPYTLRKTTLNGWATLDRATCPGISPIEFDQAEHLHHGLLYSVTVQRLGRKKEKNIPRLGFHEPSSNSSSAVDSRRKSCWPVCDFKT